MGVTTSKGSGRVHVTWYEDCAQHSHRSSVPRTACAFLGREVSVRSGGCRGSGTPRVAEKLLMTALRVAHEEEKDIICERIIEQARELVLA